MDVGGALWHRCAVRDGLATNESVNPTARGAQVRCAPPLGRCQRGVGLALVAGAALACGDSAAGDNIPTSGLVLVADVVADGGDTVSVTVEFKVGGPYSNTYAALESEDQLRVVVDGETTVLSETDVGVYEGVVGAPAPGGTFRLVLDREDHEDARATRGVLPPAFDLTSLPDNAALSRAEDPIELRWMDVGVSGSGDMDSSQDAMTVEVSGAGCFVFERLPVTAQGAITVAAGELEPVDADASGTCEGTISVMRTRLGEVDGTLDGDSVVRMRQVRTLTFTSKP